MMKKVNDIKIIIYSGSSVSPYVILEDKVKQRFGIEIDPSALQFVKLDDALHQDLHPGNYPSFTLFW